MRVPLCPILSHFLKNRRKVPAWRGDSRVWQSHAPSIIRLPVWSMFLAASSFIPPCWLMNDVEPSGGSQWWVLYRWSRASQAVLVFEEKSLTPVEYTAFIWLPRAPLSPSIDSRGVLQPSSPAPSLLASPARGDSLYAFVLLFSLPV